MGGGQDRAAGRAGDIARVKVRAVPGASAPLFPFFIVCTVQLTQGASCDFFFFFCSSRM